MVVLPMWKGGRIENRWQPMSALTWCSPSSRCTSFSAANTGRSGQPVHRPGGRACTSIGCSGITFGGAGGQPAGQLLADEGAQALVQHLRAVFAGHGQQALADQLGLQVVLAQHAGDALLDEVGLAFLDQQHRALAGAEAHQFRIDQRVGDVHHVQRQLAAAVDIGQAQPLHRAQQRVVQAALHDDADVGGALGEELVEAALFDELLRRRPALLDLLVLVHEAGGRQHDAVQHRAAARPSPRRGKRPGAGCPWR